jgi:hypothetical protein
MTIAPHAPAKAMFDPDERSVPASIIIKVIPSERVAKAAFCFSRFIKVFTEKKPDAVYEKNI